MTKVPKEGLKVKEVYRLEHVKYIFESEVTVHTPRSMSPLMERERWRKSSELWMRLADV